MQKTEFGQQAIKASETIVKQTTETIETIGKSEAFKKLQEGARTVHAEIDDSGTAHTYRAPEHLQKRVDRDPLHASAANVVEPDSEATGVQLHKDSQWYQSWQKFKENNAYASKLFEFKSRYEESNNPVVRASRLLTEKLSDLFGS